jgi:dihydrofolate synthase/folylpolyglutamate synthase
MDVGVRGMRLARFEAWRRCLEEPAMRRVDLGIERLRLPAQRLGVARLECTVVKVAGTNGKGSSVAMLDALLRAAGYRVACYTSPALERFDECLVIDGRRLAEAQWVEALDAVEEAQACALTGFELQTLAAALLVARSGVDVALMEMGLGGARDAVNVLAADAVLFTTLDVDHVDWLGADREEVAREKAGVLARGVPAVCADPDPPAALLREAARVGAPMMIRGAEFDLTRDPAGWHWRCSARTLGPLPEPGIPGSHQVDNAAGVLALLEVLRDRHPVPADGVGRALAVTRLRGRHQIVGCEPLRLVDVAHNPQSARALSRTLCEQPITGRTHLVLAMLSDKDAVEVVAALAEVTDAWYLASLPGPRGASAGALGDALRRVGVRGPVTSHESPARAWHAALVSAGGEDRVVACGSFLVAACVLGLETSPC